jgi:DNA-binding LacI/PurR family transcriptional regulator
LPEGDDDRIIEHAWEICQQLIDLQVKGVFFFPLDVSPAKVGVNEKIANALDQAGIAVTLLDHDVCSWPKRSKFDVVGIRNEQASFALTEYLISLGCKRIDFVSGNKAQPAVTERIYGYQSALLRHDIIPQPKHIHDFHAMVSNDNEKNAADRILKSSDAEALICTNDRLAATIMQYALNLGKRVPGDLRIVGFDDEAFCSYLPVPLTTMRQPAAALGSEAVRTIISRIKNPQIPGRQILLAAELVIRKSCGGK